jgi:hypothetical protein
MPHRRHALPLAALLAGVALLASACSLTRLPAPKSDQPPPARASRAARKPGPIWATGAPVRVVMNDHFRYRPSAIMAPPPTPATPRAAPSPSPRARPDA